MPTKAEQVSELEVAYVEFRDLISTLPNDWFERPGLGDWTLAQLLAHMAGWYRTVAIDLVAVARGEEPHAREYFQPEDEWNARFVADPRVGMAALDDFDIGFHEFYAGLKALGDDAYAEYGFGSLALGAVGLRHFAEHRPEIEAWLQR